MAKPFPPRVERIEREAERGGEIPHSAKARAHSVCRSRTGRGGGNQLGWKRVREKLDALISNFHDWIFIKSLHKKVRQRYKDKTYQWCTTLTSGHRDLVQQHPYQAWRQAERLGKSRRKFYATTYLPLSWSKYMSAISFFLVVWQSIFCQRIQGGGSCAVLPFCGLCCIISSILRILLAIEVWDENFFLEQVILRGVDDKQNLIWWIIQG